MATNALDPDYLYAGLIDRGLPPHIAQAFVMNARDESGLNPGINEAEPIVPGSRGGWGLLQWTGPRRRGLESLASERGVDPSDPGLQMDYLLSELEGPESRAWGRIRGTDTAEQAAAAIVNDFLRPAESHRARRERNYLSGATFSPDSGYEPGLGYTPAARGIGSDGESANAFDPRLLEALARRRGDPMEDLPALQTPKLQASGFNALAAPAGQFYGDWFK